MIRAFVVAVAFAVASPALAQDEPTMVDEVIVEARRSGAPTWEVTRGESTVLLVGAIQALPRSLDWRADALERAAERADSVLYSQAVALSPGDILRILWRQGTLTRLPRGKTSADYLTPEWQARLEVLDAKTRDDLMRQSFFQTSAGLLFGVTNLNRNRGPSVEDAVRRTARRGRTPSQRIGEVRGDAVIEDLLTMPPETWVPCVQLAIVAGEAGEAGMLERAAAWRRFDVPTVMESPLEQALSQCWPWGDPDWGIQLRAQWLTGIEDALAQDGTTLAVAPLRVLAEPGGLLDTLEARGFEIVGPVWKR
ncbi:MAG TPA: TraB/GumN family protein [Brevundimonas sp.]|uniref:TraB/GumN family protein n=1 Tax=Brevundimonas sp. TaxID=1871086 RepID=UPI002DF3C289|nr:TraB/GumN family protein [Brevundimonas sp.]